MNSSARVSCVVQGVVGEHLRFQVVLQCVMLLNNMGVVEALGVHSRVSLVLQTMVCQSVVSKGRLKREHC